MIHKEEREGKRERRRVRGSKREIVRRSKRERGGEREKERMRENSALRKKSKKQILFLKGARCLVQ